MLDVRTKSGKLVGQYKDMMQLAFALADHAEKLERIENERKAFQNDTQTLTCIFCGHQYPPGTPPSNHELLVEHIKACKEHPLYTVLQALTRLVDDVDKYLAAECVHSSMDTERGLMQSLTRAKELVGMNA